MPKKHTSQAFDDLFSLKDQDWISEAACRILPKTLFFSPEQSASSQTAKFVCRGCPVKLDCLNYALQSPWMSGIFGGTDEKERRRMIKDGYAA